jgi:hypothetical protein
MHRVEDRTEVQDGQQSLHVPAGWQIADGTADDIRVCGAHPWQSQCLVFANGAAYGTAACSLSSFIGDRSFCCSVGKFTKIYKISISSLKPKIREKIGRRLPCKGGAGGECERWLL